jgi:regulator of sigma E protease
MNLLPIPILDGGHIIFFLIEAIFRRPVSIKRRDFAFKIGLFLLIALMLFATYNDIIRLLK